MIKKMLMAYIVKICFLVVIWHYSLGSYLQQESVYRYQKIWSSFKEILLASVSHMKLKHTLVIAFTFSSNLKNSAGSSCIFHLVTFWDAICFYRYLKYLYIFKCRLLCLGVHIFVLTLHVSFFPQDCSTGAIFDSDI